MDLGATICTPRKPVCSLCPLRPDCEGHRAGLEAELPRKAPKAEKPVREGRLWIAVRADGAVLLETRPERGMLGGMLGWPGTDWDRSGGPAGAPLEADWRETGVEVRHTFTHFHLRLEVLVAQVAEAALPARGSFVPRADFRPAALPTPDAQGLVRCRSGDPSPDRGGATRIGSRASTVASGVVKWFLLRTS